ncbi:MAG: T9SS type A sorting domain-containing protein [Bacteroidetes bacterium]|nr:T9SS type A sorting domain-containing protein [Bacteroidota bacterium]
MVRIQDLRGVMLFTGEGDAYSQIAIDVSTWAKGVYMTEVITQGGHFLSKLVVY